MDPLERARLVREFVTLFADRNFVSFDELSQGLGVAREQLFSLKADFETAIRREDNTLNLTSRVDLDPPGWEISD